jgi:hypothetical protein
MGLSRRTSPWAIHGYPRLQCSLQGWLISLTPGIGGAPDIPFLRSPEWQDDPLFAKPRSGMAEPEKFDALILRGPGTR